MAKVKISISKDEDLYRRVRGDAGEEGVSAWLSAVATKDLRSTGLREIAERDGRSDGQSHHRGGAGGGEAVAALVFDSGALIALERDDHVVAEMLLAASLDGIDAITASACIALTWRDPARQVRLTCALERFLERPLDAEGARACGLLLARSRTDDIADAAVVLLAQDGDTILTSDPDDIEHLLAVAGTSARVRRV